MASFWVSIKDMTINSDHAECCYVEEHYLVVMLRSGNTSHIDCGSREEAEATRQKLNALLVPQIHRLT